MKYLAQKDAMRILPEDAFGGANKKELK